MKRTRSSGQPSRTRVVFIGDSITEGWAGQPSFKNNPDFVGRGIGGQTLPQMLVRFRADAIELKPAVIHLMGGTNDVAENTGPESDAEIQGYIMSMVELARAHDIKVVLASIPPASDFPWRQGLNPAPRIKRLNAWSRDYATRQGLVYVDYASVLATSDGGMKPEFSEDGVHPNAAATQRCNRSPARRFVRRCASDSHHLDSATKTGSKESLVRNRVRVEQQSRTSRTS